MNKILATTALALVLSQPVWAESHTTAEGDAAADMETDAEAGTDMETDAEATTEAEGDAAADTEADAAADTEADAEAEADGADMEADAAAEGDAETDMSEDAGDAVEMTNDAETDTEMTEGDAEMTEGDAEVVEGDAEMVDDGAMATDGVATEAEPLELMEVTDMTIQGLIDGNVYTSEDEDVGEVVNALVDAEGTITDLIIDVGGFLGIGEKRVQVPLADVSLMAYQDSDDIRVYTEMTREQLEGMPEYED